MGSQSEIRKLIENGPRSVEAAFEAWSNGSNSQRESEDRYKNLIEIVKRESSNLGKSWASFLSGYLNQQVGTRCADNQGRLNFYKESLANYRFFLDSHKRVNPDVAYFAQWQIGWLQRSLEADWAVVEESFLKALECCHERGEALREIIIYWCLKENWRIAYIYSSYCKRHFLGNIPDRAKWHVNIPFYTWKILKYHVPILLNLNRKTEARECAQELFRYYSGYHVIDVSEIKEINLLKEVWAQWL